MPIFGPIFPKESRGHEHRKAIIVHLNFVNGPRFAAPFGVPSAAQRRGRGVVGAPGQSALRQIDRPAAVAAQLLCIGFRILWPGEALSLRHT